MEVLLMGLYKVGLAIAGVIVGALALRQLYDKNGHFIDKIRDFTQPEATYYGLRFLGMCILVGYVVG